MEEVKLNNDMHVFICINEREDRDSCSPCIGLNEFKEIKEWLKDEKLFPKIKCTKTGCLGMCNPKGGALAIYPQKKFFKNIENIQEIKDIIIKEYHNIK